MRIFESGHKDRVKREAYFKYGLKCSGGGGMAWALRVP
jgi:hypothetical protein